MTNLAREGCLIALGIAGVVSFIVLGMYTVTKHEMRELEREMRDPTHYFICEEMTKAVAVYGNPKAEGSYLRVRLSRAETSYVLIGPDCLILPAVGEVVE